MSKHTAGPWSINKVDGPEYGGPEVIQSWIRGKPLDQHLDGVVVASIVSDCIPEAHANANLVAAAPDLLEALEGMVSLFPTGVEDEGSGIGFNENLKTKYRAAVKTIARAKGKT